MTAQVRCRPTRGFSRLWLCRRESGSRIVRLALGFNGAGCMQTNKLCCFSGTSVIVRTGSRQVIGTKKLSKLEVRLTCNLIGEFAHVVASAASVGRFFETITIGLKLLSSMCFSSSPCSSQKLLGNTSCKLRRYPQPQYSIMWQLEPPSHFVPVGEFDFSFHWPQHSLDQTFQRWFSFSQPDSHTHLLAARVF